MEEDRKFDVVVVGGGVVGCFVFYEFIFLGFWCVFCEKEENFVCGVSLGNSGIFYMGFDVLFGSLELWCF